MDKKYDSHVHLHVDRNDSIPEYDYYDIDNLLIDQKKYNIEKSICFLNPFVPEMLCPINHKHRIQVLDSDYTKLQIYCQDCRKIFYEGTDPLRPLNIKLLEQTKNIKSVIPFVYLNISKAINSEVMFFERNYGGLVKGYKVHPKLCSRKISDIIIESTKPIIIHAGVQDITSPAEAIKFAKNYEGNVILAHCARFSENDLLAIRKTSNLYIDISPFMILYKSYIEKPNVLYDMSYLGNVSNPTDLLTKLIKTVGIDKIIFGTDVPFTNIEQELEFISNCDILNIDREQILYNNLLCLLHREENNEENSKEFTFKSKKN